MEPIENPESYETIRFFNKSFDAISYEWNFGDGETSEKENPLHIYDWPGTYNVTLTAFDDRLSNTITQTITINSPTVLQLELITIDMANVLGDCEVSLYDNEYDWEVEKRAQYFTYSSFNGKCSFFNLEDQVYYIRVYKYTDFGIWKGSKTIDKMNLNEIVEDIITCEFTPYEEF